MDAWQPAACTDAARKVEALPCSAPLPRNIDLGHAPASQPLAMIGISKL